ncbi:hypothetical protein D9M73_119450 [compost metagenome]
MADRHGTGHRDGHERVHVQVEIFQRDPALLVSAEPAGGNGYQRECDHHPVDAAVGPVDDFGQYSRHSRENHRQPVGLRHR